MNQSMPLNTESPAWLATTDFHCRPGLHVENTHEDPVLGLSVSFSIISSNMGITASRCYRLVAPWVVSKSVFVIHSVGVSLRAADNVPHGLEFSHLNSGFLSCPKKQHNLWTFPKVVPNWYDILYAPKLGLTYDISRMLRTGGPAHWDPRHASKSQVRSRRTTNTLRQETT